MDKLIAMRHGSISIPQWRWIIVCAQGLGAGAICFVLVKSVDGTFEAINSRLAFAGYEPLAFAAMLATALATYTIASRRVKAAIGFKHFFCLPPISTSLFLGIATYLLCDSTTRSFSSLFDAESLWGVVPPIVGVALGMALGGLAPDYLAGPANPAQPLRSKRLDPASDDPRTSEFEENFSIDDWLDADDRPIQRPEDDMFGRTIVAARLLNRLAGLGEPTIVLRGPRGIGKSSILELMKSYCTDPSALPRRFRETEHVFSTDAGQRRIWCRDSHGCLKRLRFLQVSAWRYSSTESLIHAVIESIVEVLHKEADVYFLRRLPDQYIDAMRKGGGFLTTLSCLLFVSPNDQKAVVYRLAAFLGAADLRVIVWLDDLDRFFASSTDAQQEMLALLDLFRIIDHISFVLAVGTDS
ncbi:MAG: ATP-binding protein [Planctomycetes bacterium]|nr:ATP-binding protein [Planctomycetota bacterium]